MTNGELRKRKKKENRQEPTHKIWFNMIYIYSDFLIEEFYFNRDQNCGCNQKGSCAAII